MTEYIWPFNSRIGPARGTNESGSTNENAQQWKPCNYGYQPNCSQCNSILGPFILIALVAVRLTSHISEFGPQAAMAILSSSPADATTFLISVSMSGRLGITPCNVESHSCVVLVMEVECFSTSFGKLSNLELEVDIGE
jgi:hypothetical protein